MEFKVVSSDTENSDALSANPRERMSKLIEDNPVFLFMKGTPEAPQYCRLIEQLFLTETL